MKNYLNNKSKRKYVEATSGILGKILKIAPLYMTVLSAFHVFFMGHFFCIFRKHRGYFFYTSKGRDIGWYISNVYINGAAHHDVDNGFNTQYSTDGFIYFISEFRDSGL